MTTQAQMTPEQKRAHEAVEEFIKKREITFEQFVEAWRNFDIAYPDYQKKQKPETA